MLSWSYKGGFFGNYLCVGKILPQSRSPARAALNRQGGSVEPPEVVRIPHKAVRSLLVAQKEKQEAKLRHILLDTLKQN